MATLQVITASNAPLVDEDAISEIEKTIANYDIPGLNVTVEEHPPNAVDADTDNPPRLWIHGYASFDVTKPVVEDGEVVDRERGFTEEFLQTLAPHLEEKLVVETVGHEKCRFPLLSSQWAVWPDGTIYQESLEHDVTKPEETQTEATA